MTVPSGLADQRRAGQAVPGEQGGALVNRRRVLRAVGPHGNGVHRHMCAVRTGEQVRFHDGLPGGGRLDGQRLRHHGAARRREAEAGAMR